jgi:predicted esterase
MLLLHGTGGNEDDHLPLGHELDPNAALLSPKAKILEGGSIVSHASLADSPKAYLIWMI